jgi:hypothetical protein
VRRPLARERAPRERSDDAVRLEFGDYVLLRSELINAYAQAVITSLRDDPLERGCIAESASCAAS